MNKDIDLQELEKKAWRSWYVQDGFFDIFIGILLLTMAIRTFTDNVWFTFLMFAGILLFILGKKYVTIPRVGMVKLGQTRRMKRVKIFSALLISFILIFCLYIYTTIDKDPVASVSSLLVAIFIAAIFAILAYYLDFLRLFIYGLMMAGGEILWGIYGEPIGPTSALISGSIIFVIGFIILARFLNKHPLPKGAHNVA